MTETSAAPAFEQPDLTPMIRANRSVRVRPAGDGDVPFIWDLFASDEISYRWIFRGRVPSVETVRHHLQRPDMLPYVIETVADRRRVGYVTAFDISDRNGHAQVGTAVAPAHLSSGLGVTATILFADYLFAVLPLRKVYLQSIEYSFAQYASLVARGYADQEGVLREHEYFAGKYWDVYLLSVTRDRFMKLRENTRLYDR